MIKKTSFFLKLGQITYQFRFLIIISWIILLSTCIPFLSDIMRPFQSNDFVAQNSDSATSHNFLKNNLKGYSNQFVILYSSETISTENPIFNQKIKKSLEKLENFSLKHEIIYPTEYNHQISGDHHNALVTIIFDSNKHLDHKKITQLKNAITKPKNINLYFGGDAIFADSVNQQTEYDLKHADKFAMPLSIIVFILVFGNLVAAFMPLLLGGGCALLILLSLYVIAGFFDLSIFTINIALLLGLCLSLDYSLFIISRFKEELKLHKNIKNAISKTILTSGRAVFFSGLAVFVSLSALLFFPINILFSMSIGGLTAVFIAVLLSLTLLPAILSVLGKYIHALPLYKIRKTSAYINKGFWFNLAKTVVKNRIIFFISTLLLLGLIASPFLKVCIGISDHKALALHSEERAFFENYIQSFDEPSLTPIILLIKPNTSYKNNSMLSNKNSKIIGDLINKLNKNPRISQVNPTHISKSFVVINITSKYGINDVKTKNLINKLKKIKINNKLELHLTGAPVIQLDIIHSIKKVFPYAAIWVIILTYFILLFLLKSIFLPFKAILMNILSLTASYGALVFIFQEGHLHNLLHFEPQGILDLNILIIIFCALFGFSMDYEVFLLTRIQESYKRTHNNDKSIIYGITKSSRIITSAAVIVMVLCGSFMVADVIMVKAFGLGIAVAIFVDAFIIRTLLVPSTMALLKKWNWFFWN